MVCMPRLTTLLLRCALLLCLLPGTGNTAPAALDLLARAEKAMGSELVHSIQYLGQGSSVAPGQGLDPTQPGPRVALRGYALLADYDNAALREESLSGPEQRTTSFVHGQAAWSMRGPVPVPAPWAVDERLVQLWTTPHGALRAARRNATTLRQTAARTLAFTEPGLMDASITLNANDQVQEVRATVAQPVWGDSSVVASYADYPAHSIPAVPRQWRQSWNGTLVRELRVEQVVLNPAFVISTPAMVDTREERVTHEVLAPGVWLLGGSAHHGVAIAMQDHVLLVDSPLSEARGLALLQAVKALVPDKPVSFVLNTHPHLDTAGGVRAALSEGATLMAAESQRAWWSRVLASPHRLQPDALARARKTPRVLSLGAKTVLSDGARTVEVHALRGNPHARDLLVVYLPADKLLIEVDAYTPGAPFSAAPVSVQPGAVNLLENLQRLQLDVERIAPLHGRMVPLAELQRAAGKAP